MEHAEIGVGMALKEWWERQYPTHRTALIHIPNGAYFGGNAVQRAMQGRRLKAQGMRRGASDYFLALPRGGYAGLWLEIKAVGGRPTPEQREFLLERAAAGYCAEWAAGIDAARAAITRYMAGQHAGKPDDSTKGADHDRIRL